MNPLKFFSTYRRPRASGEPYCPFNFQIRRDLQGQNCQYFDSQGFPCEPGRHLFISIPSDQVPPPGYTWVGGHPPTIPENILNPEQTQSIVPTSTPIDEPAPTIQQQALIEDDAELDSYIITRGYDGFYIQPPKQRKPRRATNFLINLVAVKHKVKGETDNERQILFDVVILSTLCIRLEIPYGDLKNILSVVSDNIGETITYHSATGAFYAELQTLLREELASCPHKYEIGISGWSATPTGRYFYAEDGATPPDESIQFKTGFQFGRGTPTRVPEQVVLDACEILKLSEAPSVISVPFLFAHMGLLWGLFKAAGYPPHTLLFIEGPTGSLKTAVASLVFNFSGQPEANIPATFRDTSSSQEIKFSKYRDRVLLVDDFCPASDAASRRVMEQSLEQLVRFFGDGIARARATPSMEEIKEKRPCGLVAITGEDSAGSQSSLLRCLFLRVEKDSYDKTLLHKFQENPALWTEYLALFVEHAAPRAGDIIRYIAEKFPLYRKEGEGLLKERRLVDTYAWLAVTADILVQVLQTVVNIQAENTQKAFHDDAMRVCLASEAKAKSASPVKIFAQTLLDLFHRNQISLGDVASFEASPDEYLGAVHKGHWYLWPNEAFSAVRNAYASTGRTFPLSMTALWGALAAAGILIPTEVKSKGISRVEYGTRVSFAGRPRLLKIVPQRLQEVADSED